MEVNYHDIELFSVIKLGPKCCRATYMYYQSVQAHWVGGGATMWVGGGVTDRIQSFQTCCTS